MDRPLEVSRLASAGLVALLLAIFALGLLCAPALAKAPKPPKGAVKVNPTNVVLITKGVWCAKSPGNWKSYVPGKRLLVGKGKRKKAYFISALQRAKQARSAKQTKRFQKIHRRYLKKCRSINTLRLDIKNAVGIATTRKRGPGRSDDPSSGGDLEILLASGTVREAVVAGEADIEAFVLAPTGSLFLWLREPILLTNGAYGDPDTQDESLRGVCTFIEVNRENGNPVCVDRTLRLTDDQGSRMARNVQVASNGEIYYEGFFAGSYCPSDQKLCPRLKSREADMRWRFDLGFVNDHHTGFQILSDDTALIGSGGYLMRVVSKPFSPEGVWVDFPSGDGDPVNPASVRWEDSTWLSVFPDANAYVGLRASTPTKRESWIGRFITSEGKMDPDPWIGSTPTSTHNTTALCSGSQAPKTFCADTGTSIKDQFSTPGGSHYLISGSGSEGELIKVFPSLSAPPTAVARISVATNAGERILLAGEDDNGQDIFTILDPITNAEKILLGPGSGTRITQLQVAPSGLEAFFAGQRSSDGRNVLGRVDLATDTASIIGELESEWLDFQTFGSG